MPIKELKEKYGKSLKSPSVINRAVRAEVPGGSHVLDLLQQLFPMREREEFQPVYRKLEMTLGAMRDFVAQKYELKTGKAEAK